MGPAQTSAQHSQMNIKTVRRAYAKDSLNGYEASSCPSYLVLHLQAIHLTDHTALENFHLLFGCWAKLIYIQYWAGDFGSDSTSVAIIIWDSLGQFPKAHCELRIRAGPVICLLQMPSQAHAKNAEMSDAKTAQSWVQTVSNHVVELPVDLNKQGYQLTYHK